MIVRFEKKAEKILLAVAVTAAVAVLVICGYAVCRSGIIEGFGPHPSEVH